MEVECNATRIYLPPELLPQILGKEWRLRCVSSEWNKIILNNWNNYVSQLPHFQVFASLRRKLKEWEKKSGEDATSRALLLFKNTYLPPSIHIYLMDYVYLRKKQSLNDSNDNLFEKPVILDKIPEIFQRVKVPVEIMSLVRPRHNHTFKKGQVGVIHGPGNLALGDTSLWFVVILEAGEKECKVLCSSKVTMICHPCQVAKIIDDPKQPILKFLIN
jgi:hypothetical protein